MNNISLYYLRAAALPPTPENLLINPLKLGKPPLRHAASAMDGAAAFTLSRRSRHYRKLWFWLLFFLLLLLWILATFSSCCCKGFCCSWSGWENTMAVKDGEAPNVTLKPKENDDFGCFFLLLLLWILATFSSCCCKGFCCCCWSPDRKTPWQWRTEKPLT